MSISTLELPANVVDRVSSTSDCALLIALPLTYDAFRRDVEAAQSIDPKQSRGDYAFQMTMCGHGGNVEAAWKQDGAIVADLCKELVSEAQFVGVRFVDDMATANSIKQAADSGASVILLVAHWRGARVTKYDLRPSIQSRLYSISIGRFAHDCFENVLHHQLKIAHAQYGRKLRLSEIAKTLNCFLESGDQCEINEVRDELDQRFTDCIIPGSCLELRDGYHKTASLTRHLPTDWSGVFDLGVCHSIRLALALKSGRSDRLVITNEAQKQPDRCLRELRETLLRLYAHPGSYIRLRASVFKAYSTMIKG